MPGITNQKRFGVYVHWPFCASKCPYCDFNSHVAATIDHDSWRKAYDREIAHYASQMPERTVTSIFFGGGTPSLMEPKTVESVLKAIDREWGIAAGAEITLEANPTSIEIGKFAGFRAAGINRVSVGIQSLRDDDLKFLGRQHSAEEAKKALGIARGTFDRFSFDLIYARPKQSVQEWREELSEALDIADGHLSLYQLTIEKGTPFFLQHERGEFKVPDDDLGGELYEVTQDIMNAHGCPAYEVSNHARAGQESQHNLTYWRYDDYAGIGPGAHGRLTLGGKKFATRGHRAPDIWMQRAIENGHGSHPFEEVTAGQRFTEALMMGLRLREGISLSNLESESGAQWQDHLDPARLKALCDEGLLVHDGDRLLPTIAGLQRLNGVLSYLV